MFTLTSSCNDCSAPPPGLLTTPQLHYLVRCINLSDRSDEPTEDSYYKQISGAFDELAKLSAPPAVAPCRVMVDGANGVGALQMRKLLMAMKGLSLQATVTFDGSQGKLNFEVCCCIRVIVT